MVTWVLIISICTGNTGRNCRMVEAGAYVTMQECKDALVQWKTDPKFRGKVRYQCAIRISGLAGEEEQ